LGFFFSIDLLLSGSSIESLSVFCRLLLPIRLTIEQTIDWEREVAQIFPYRYENTIPPPSLLFFFDKIETKITFFDHFKAPINIISSSSSSSSFIIIIME
jgi:hypothetical protein